MWTQNASARAGCKGGDARAMLALQEGGRGGDAPLVLIHGFLCAGAFFAPLTRRLAARRRFVTVDLPGFGESRNLPPANSIQAMAEQTQKTLAAAGVGRFYLLGHSMGGMVALQLALQAPAQVAGLIVYAGNGSGNLPNRFETFAESKRRLRKNFAAGKRQICATWLMDGEQNPHFALLAQCAARVRQQTAQRAIDAMRDFDATARLHELKMPTLVVSAERDRTYSLSGQRQLQAAIAQAQWKIIRGCAHCAHLEKERQFAAVICRWLAANAGGS